MKCGEWYDVSDKKKTPYIPSSDPVKAAEEELIRRGAVYWGVFV